MKPLLKFIWITFYRPNIFERIQSGCFETWAEVKSLGMPRRKIVIIIYKLSYFLFKNSELAFFSKFSAKKITFAQKYQDLFVLYNVSHGSFIEIGASDGVTDNNTYLLENLGWKGILFEPNKNFSKELSKNRSCMVDKRAVYVESEQTVDFSIDRTATFSGIIKFKEQYLTSQEVIKIKTISLNDIFKLLNLEEVTYLSIDTEGTEFEILNAFDFGEHKICIITVEHNGDLKKALRIHKLLVRKGYTRKFKYISGPDFFYTLNTLKVR